LKIISADLYLKPGSRRHHDFAPVCYHGQTLRYPHNRKYKTYHIVTGGGPSHGYTGNIHRKFVEVWTCRFWATVCKTVSSILSSPKGAQPPIFGSCLLWPNGSMDQDATWYGGRPRPGHIVLDGDPAPSPLETAPNFRSMSVLPKRLDGSRCHLVGR